MKLGPLVLIGGFRTGEHGEQRCAAFIDFVALEIELDFHSNPPASDQIPRRARSTDCKRACVSERIARGTTETGLAGLRPPPECAGERRAASSFPDSFAIVERCPRA